MTTAESNVLNAAANYEKSKVQLDKSTAETLTKLGIDIADAEAGQVKHAPTVKGVVPANVQELTSPMAALCAATDDTTTRPRSKRNLIARRPFQHLRMEAEQQESRSWLAPALT